MSSVATAPRDAFGIIFREGFCKSFFGAFNEILDFIQCFCLRFV